MWATLPEEFSQGLLTRESLSLGLLPAISYCSFLAVCYYGQGKGVVLGHSDLASVFDRRCEPESQQGAPAGVPALLELVLS